MRLRIYKSGDAVAADESGPVFAMLPGSAGKVAGDASLDRAAITIGEKVDPATHQKSWVPAFAGMTGEGALREASVTPR
jgi:hypothetical protein